jgi:hypothetical protein
MVANEPLKTTVGTTTSTDDIDAPTAKVPLPDTRKLDETFSGGSTVS